MSKRKKLSSQLNNVFNAANDSFSPLSLGNLAAWYQPGVGLTGSLTASAWNDQADTTKYAYLPGVAGNYFSTPDSAANSITGDIDVRVYAALNNWNTGDYQDLIGKCQDANKRSYWLGADNSGKFAFSYGTDGTSFLTLTSSVVHGLTAGQLTWVRITRNATTGVGKFYLSTDGATWNQLGADVASATGAMFDSVSAVEVGAIFAGAFELPAGKIYRAQIYNGIDGTLVVDFNPSDSSYISANGDTFTASTGEVWTLNNTSTANQAAIQSGNALKMGVAGNQPIYLPYSGTAYAYLPGVSLNYFSTPDSAAAGITGDIDLRAYAAADDWTPAATGILTCKDSGVQRSYLIYLNTDGTLSFAYSNDGANLRIATSSVATGIANATASWVRATYASATGKVNFYTSSDGSTWSALGTEQSLTAGAIYDSIAPVEVGTNALGSNCFLGKIYRAQIYNGIDGTLVVDFNPSTFAETSTNGATAVASTGETWTLNSTGAKPAQIVKSASLLFDGTDDYLKTAAFTLNQPITYYLVAKQITWTDTRVIVDGDTIDSSVIYQSGSTPQLRIYAGTPAGLNGDMAVGAKSIITASMNGAASKLQINAGVDSAVNAGTQNAAGLTLGSKATGALPSNIQAWELIAFSAAHTAAQRAVVQNYLAARHSIAL